jgi:hypothetical protein
MRHGFEGIPNGVACRAPRIFQCAEFQGIKFCEI